MRQRPGFTRTEQSFDDLANRWLGAAPTTGPVSWLVEFLVFGLKQAWACLFGAAMLIVIVGSKFWYPDSAALARNDFLTLAGIAIQLLMVLARFETLRELRVIVLFHLVGTGMELFKTAVGSWEYSGGGVLHIGAVPLFSGFMYAAIGSYMVRVFRLFDLRFDRYPPRWLTAVLAVLIYARTVMHFRIFRVRARMPIFVAFALVALFIWFAENIGTFSGAWTYPDQQAGWQLVSIAKLGSWFLLMIISVVLVTWIYPPQPLDRVGRSTASST